MPKRSSMHRGGGGGGGGRDKSNGGGDNANQQQGGGMTLEEEQNLMNQPSVRNILGYVERYDRKETQELLAQMSSHWLLSLDDFKIPIENPVGLISQMAPLNDDFMLLLVPYDEQVGSLDYRELHQILRELTIGMYVLNQHPSLHLEANFGESTSCQLPPAYVDTKLGQIMINADYWLKALWHGAYFPKEKRIKFAERWRQLLDANGVVAQTKKSVFGEFLDAGLCDIAKDADYGEIYASVVEDTTLKTFGLDLTHQYTTTTSSKKANNSDDEERSSSSSQAQPMEYTDFADMTDEQIQEEMNFFMTYMEDIQLELIFGLSNIKSFRNLYEIEPIYTISSSCKASNERIDNAKFERLKRRLNVHERFLRKHYARKKEVKKYLNTLKIVGFLVPLLIALKKRMRIPDLNNLLPCINGDEVHTERELPPLMLGSDFKSKNMMMNYTLDKYFNLHGAVQFELETCSIESVDKIIKNSTSSTSSNADEYLRSEYENIEAKATSALRAHLQSEQQQEYHVPVIEINGKKYWCMRLDIESFYPQFPQKPFWISKLNEDVVKLKPKRVVMGDVQIIQIYEIFRKYFGFKKATKFKSIPAGLRASAQRGLIGIFHYFAKKAPANLLAKHDEFGLGLMHYAAIHNYPLIVSSLVMNGIDANIKQQVDYMAIGPMPLHYAARTGSLDAISCLISNFANISFADHEGWAPVHHAAFFDNVAAIKLFSRKQPEIVDLITRSETRRRTPLLLAASSGSLEAVKCLIELGANLSFQDDTGYNIIHIATHKSHTNIIDYFIANKYAQLDIWKILIGMLDKESDFDKESSTRCLTVLTNQNKTIWPAILASGGVEKLCSILKRYSTFLLQGEEKEELKRGESKKQANSSLLEASSSSSNLNNVVSFAKQQTQTVVNNENNHHQQQQIVVITLNALSVLCNLSDQVEIRAKLCEIGDLANVLVNILEHSSSEDIQSRVAILLGDMASYDEHYKRTFAEKKSLDILMRLLRDSDLEDLLVNSVNAVEIICNGNYANQCYCCEHGLFEIFIALVELNSDLLRSSVAAAVASLVSNNSQNQMASITKGLIRPLVGLLKSRNMTVQLKVAMAIESLALGNQSTQNAILAMDAANYMIQLLEIKANMDDWSIIIREQAAVTLWALAGSPKPQRKAIAEKVGVSQIISMLLSKSEKLQYVGCRCMIALVLENAQNQHKILEENGIDPLIRLLKSDKTSHRVIAATVDTIGSLCVDIAHVNNERMQRELIDKGALVLLTDLLEKPFSKEIQINTAHALASLLLNLPEEKLADCHYELDIESVLALLDTADLDQRLRAGLAITVLAYNNSKKQYEIKELGGISFRSYKVFFEPNNKCTHLQICEACFQIVVLARIIHDWDQVSLTAMGITRLVDLLLSSDDQVIIQSASYMSSLAHTRAGITDAMITCDAVDILCDLLYSPNEQIKFAAAVTLGYLTYNRTASRILLHNCRNVPQLYDTLVSLMRTDTKISRQFLESYQTALQLGLPKLLVKSSSSSKIKDDDNEDNDVGKMETKPSFYHPISLEKSKTQYSLHPRQKTTNSTSSSRVQSAPMSKLRSNHRKNTNNDDEDDDDHDVKISTSKISDNKKITNKANNNRHSATIRRKPMQAMD